MSGSSHPIKPVSAVAGHQTDASGDRVRQIESELAAEQTFTTRLMKAAWQPVLSGVTGGDGAARKRQRRAGDVDLETQLRDEHRREMLLLQAMSAQQAPQYSQDQG